MKSKSKEDGTGLITPKASKPTRAEIVGSLLERAYEKHKADLKEHEAQKLALIIKIEERARKVLKSRLPKAEALACYHRGKVTTITFSLTGDEALEKLGAEYDKLKDKDAFLNWDKESARDQIAHSLDTRRPNGLLDNPEACKAMDALLVAWGM